MIMPAPARYRTTNWKIHNEALTVHIDASLIRSNVSMDALVSRHLDAVA
ncbi:hypothetical protein [Paenirhodobacter populi]|nr:hypothetical protein [Sinirhodobacter populi]